MGERKSEEGANYERCQKCEADHSLASQVLVFGMVKMAVGENGRSIV